MARRKKTMKVEEIPYETWAKMGLWLADELHDREVDADHIAETQGPDFMPAMRGLAKWMRKGGPYSKAKVITAHHPDCLPPEPCVCAGLSKGRSRA